MLACALTALAAGIGAFPVHAQTGTAGQRQTMVNADDHRDRDRDDDRGREGHRGRDRDDDRHGAAREPIKVKIIGFNDYHGNQQSPGTFGVNTLVWW